MGLCVVLFLLFWVFLSLHADRRVHSVVEPVYHLLVFNQVTGNHWLHTRFNSSSFPSEQFNTSLSRLCF